MSEDNVYTTTDFYTTAVLIATKYPVLKVTKEGPTNRVKRFHFESSEELENTVLTYMNGTLEGSLREFRNAIEVVKDLVHSS